MSIRTLAEKDLALTLESSSDFGWPFSLYNSETNEWVSLNTDGKPLMGQVHRIGTIKDPQNNLRTIINRTAISARISTLPFIPKEGTLVKTTDINGTEIAGQVKGKPQPDNTLGYVTIVIESVPEVKTAPNTVTQRKGFL